MTLCSSWVDEVAENAEKRPAIAIPCLTAGLSGLTSAVPTGFDTESITDFTSDFTLYFLSRFEVTAG